MLHLSIKTKLSLVISFLVIAFIAFNAVYYPRRVEKQIRIQAELGARQVAETAGYALGPSISEGNTKELIQVLKGVHSIPSFRFCVIQDADRKILEASPSAPDWGKRLIATKELRTELQEGGRLLIVVAPISYSIENADKVGTLVIGFTTDETQQSVRENIRAGLIVGLIALGLGIMVAVFLSTRYLKPIIQLTRAAERVANGDLESVAVPVRTGDELQELSHSFEVMTDKLRVSRDEIERQNKLLEFRVQERTRQLMETIWELEEIRSNLEQLVQERTKGLEQSRAELRAWATTLEEKVKEKTKELEQLNENLLTSYQKLKEVDRLKDEFRANMSHELRTPLNSIIGFSGMLTQDDRLPQEVRDDVQIIFHNGQSLLGLIDQILDLSKIEAGKMDVDLVEMDPIPLLEEVRAMAQGLLRNRPIELRFERSEESLRILGDPERLRQVFTNLIGNAVKFTESGEVAILALAEHGWFKVKIRDTGIGMTQEEVNRLFQPFQQVDGSITRRFGGTGLGLAISQRIMGFMDGRITARSEKGRGSTFTVEMPLKKSEEDVRV
jgi:signal transduction histidine kinase